MGADVAGEARDEVDEEGAGAPAALYYYILYYIILYFVIYYCVTLSHKFILHDGQVALSCLPRRCT